MTCRWFKTIAHINESRDSKYIWKWSILAAVAGLGFNVIFDPIVGYFYKMYVLGQPQEVVAMAWRVVIEHHADVPLCSL